MHVVSRLFYRSKLWLEMLSTEDVIGLASLLSLYRFFVIAGSHFFYALRSTPSHTTSPRGAAETRHIYIEEMFFTAVYHHCKNREPFGSWDRISLH